MHFLASLLSRRPAARLLTASLLLSCSGVGCTYFRTIGTGEHLDAQREHPHDSNHSRVREMIVEITTDAAGNVVNVRFQRSSGSDGIDGYVAQSIRDSWPRQPSTLSVASLTYSGDKGFSPPKLISSSRAP